MYLSTSILFLTTLLSTTTTCHPLASPPYPSPSKWSPNPNNQPYPGPKQTCLQPNQALEITTQFSSLLTSFSTPVATSLLSPDNFTDTSDSINFLSSLPQGSVTFPSAQAFIQGQGAQPPIGFEVLGIDAVTCEGVIAFRWLATVQAKTKELVKGINVLYVKVAEGGDAGVVGTGGWQVTRVYSEFNSAAWDRAVGGVCEPPKRG